MIDAALSGVSPIKKHELSKIDFEIIDNAFLLLQFGLDPVTNIAH
jgi:hypothetical protein